MYLKDATMAYDASQRPTTNHTAQRICQDVACFPPSAYRLETYMQSSLEHSPQTMQEANDAKTNVQAVLHARHEPLYMTVCVVVSFDKSVSPRKR